MAIHAVERAAAKPVILVRVRAFERRGIGAEPHEGWAFWDAALRVMGIEILTTLAEVARIPREGPVVLVSSRPQGLVDDMVLASSLEAIRPDDCILVPFPRGRAPRPGRWPWRTSRRVGPWRSSSQVADRLSATLRQGSLS